MSRTADSACPRKPERPDVPKLCSSAATPKVVRRCVFAMYIVSLAASEDVPKSTNWATLKGVNVMVLNWGADLAT